MESISDGDVKVLMKLKRNEEELLKKANRKVEDGEEENKKHKHNIKELDGQLRAEKDLRKSVRDGNLLILF